MYSAKTAVCNKIADQFWPEVRILQKTEVFRLCEKLLNSDYCERHILSAPGFLEYQTSLKAKTGLFLRDGLRSISIIEQNTIVFVIIPWETF